MTRKNKLYKHHKSKSYFYIKDFSFGILALLGIGIAFTVPTYIASRNSGQVEAKAESKNVVEEHVDDENGSLEEVVELQTY